MSTLGNFKLQPRFITRRQYIELIESLGLNPNATSRIVLDSDEVIIEYAGSPTVRIMVQAATDEDLKRQEAL